MIPVITAALTSLFVWTVSPASIAAQTSTQPVRCETGPARRQLGGTSWVVYSCDDRKSMILVSAEGSPASPFMFFLRKQKAGYSISSEGNGNERWSKAAAEALSKMDSVDFDALLKETERSGHSQ